DIPRLHFNLLFSRMNVDEVRLILPDKDYSPEAMAGMPPRLVEMKLQNLSISTRGLAAVALNWQNVTFPHLSIGSATIRLFENPESQAAPKEQQTEFPSHFAINDISINSLDVEVRPLAEPDVVRQLVSWLQMKGHLAVNSQEEGGDYQIDASISTGQLTFGDELHTYSVQQLNYHQDQQGLRLKGLQISPRYSKEAFSKKISFQKDRYDMLIDSVVIASLDLEVLLNSKQLLADSIVIGGGHLEVYRDRSVPFDTTQRRELPVSLIRQSSLAINIGAVTVNDFAVNYIERPENGDTEGLIPFTGLQATLNNITNIKHDLEQDSLMHITAQAHAFDQALLQAQFTYNLNDPRGGYQARGELGGLPLEKLNPVLIPLAGASVNQGVLHSATFSFSGNDIESSGTMRMRYSDLEITLEHDRSELRKNLVNWAARNFVYHANNPSPDNELREAPIEYERDPSRFVFHYWWKNFFSGIKNTVLR
ncbi:MAG: hypothetical protein R6U64_01965, partial [Bacteroidales bacterium]